MTTKVPDPVDKHVGSRVRMRRLILDMSQETLGNDGERGFDGEADSQGAWSCGATAIPARRSPATVEARDTYTMSHPAESPMKRPRPRVGTLALRLAVAVLRTTRVWRKTVDPHFGDGCGSFEGVRKREGVHRIRNGREGFLYLRLSSPVFQPFH
jgi:hypothetical protein